MSRSDDVFCVTLWAAFVPCLVVHAVVGLLAGIGMAYARIVG
jgi:hypothetical protein